MGASVAQGKHIMNTRCEVSKVPAGYCWPDPSGQLASPVVVLIGCARALSQVPDKEKGVLPATGFIGQTPPLFPATSKL